MWLVCHLNPSIRAARVEAMVVRIVLVSRIDVAQCRALACAIHVMVRAARHVVVVDRVLERTFVNDLRKWLTIKTKTDVGLNRLRISELLPRTC